MMQNKENFLFGFDFNNADSSLLKEEPHQNDIENLQKVVLQSFKYCQAKKSKNRYIRTKKIEEMKKYQQKLIAIIKKKSDDMISTLQNFSNLIIATQQTDQNEVAKKEELTLSVLKEKISSLKSSPLQEKGQNVAKSQQLGQKIKRVTLQCEEQLQKMQSQQKDKKTEEQIEKIINQMQKPFKKLCSYFNMLTKELKEEKQL